MKVIVCNEKGQVGCSEHRRRDSEQILQDLWALIRSMDVIVSTVGSHYILSGRLAYTVL